MHVENGFIFDVSSANLIPPFVMNHFPLLKQCGIMDMHTTCV